MIFPIYGFWVARRLPGIAQFGALVLAASGAALLIGGSLDLSPRYLRGDILALVAGLFYTGYLVAVDRERKHWQPLPLLWLATLAGAPPLLATALLNGEAIWPGNWAPVVGYAVSSQVIGQGLIVFSIGHLRPVVVGVVLLIQPLIAGATGWWVYDERFTATDWLGAALLGAALILVRLPQPASKA